jgi:hypothetical protein
MSLRRPNDRSSVRALVALVELVLSPPALAANNAPEEAAPPKEAAAPQEAAPPEETAPSEEEAPAEEPPPDSDRIQALEDKVAELEQRLSQQVEKQPRSWLTFAGYVDFGFFVPSGNGAGWVQDFSNQYFPQYAGQFAWVFLGDILAPTVNSRGEAADLGNAPGVTRFDSVHSGGALGFILNEVNLRINAALTQNALLTASIDFVPRTGSNFALGDFIDVDLGQLEWIPFESGRTSIFIGKMESVLGIEYRERKADKRFGITPSLIARYTTGTPLGVKVRSKFLDDERLVVALALTNGSSTTEQFHFYNEIATHSSKTGSGRVSLRMPFLDTLELGVSGEYGVQDRAPDNSGALWFFGVDLQYQVWNVLFKGQWLRGMSPGEAIAEVYGLHLNGGGYLEANWRISPLFGVLLRGEYRDAFIWLGDERAYLTKSWRATGGFRVDFTRNIVLKAEYLRNGQYGGVPKIDSDVFTSSFVLIY